MSRMTVIFRTDDDDDVMVRISDDVRFDDDNFWLQTFLEKAKLGVHNLVQRVGFFGILACASVSRLQCSVM